VPATVGLGHDHQSLALAEPGRRRPLGEPGDPLDDLAVDAPILEPSDRSTLHHDVDELHVVLQCNCAAAQPSTRLSIVTSVST